jgi:hypothetical protein
MSLENLQTYQERLWINLIQYSSNTVEINLEPLSSHEPNRGIKYSSEQLQEAENITSIGLDCLKTLKALYGTI